MRSCVLHVSDLHFGARNGLDDPALERALEELNAALRPDLVIASGDLTHNGRAREHEAAARYLRGLGVPLLVVPGNHDLPTLPPPRLMRPWREFERQWQTSEPVHAAPGLLVLGLNSVRPFGYQRGRLTRGALERAEARLAEAGPEALRIVAFHHQLASAPWRTRKLPLAGRGLVLRRLADAGAELIVCGHTHQAAIAARRDFEVLAEGARDCVLATAPGLGRPRAGRSHEVRGLLVHRAEAGILSVETHVWCDAGWQLAGTRSFARAA